MGYFRLLFKNVDKAESVEWLRDHVCLLMSYCPINFKVKKIFTIEGGALRQMTEYKQLITKENLLQ